MNDQDLSHSRPVAPPPVLVLTRAELARLMSPGDYLEAVERGFVAMGAGPAVAPAPMHIPLDGGGFHVKGAAYAEDGVHVAFKVNGNFPGNAARGAPTIQGAIVLCDGESGTLLAVMDSIEITQRRTAAATALAARFLARPDSARVMICGCGDQAMAQLAALGGVLPLRQGFAFDLDASRTAALVARAAGVLPLAPVGAAGFADAARSCDVIVTCTTARAPFLDVGHVGDGAFVAAVGADSPDKNEIAPALMARARVSVDSLAQALSMGDLRHAVAAGAMTASDVVGDLADLVAGRTAGRTRADEITLFDSTGVAIQDVASAVAAYRQARRGGVGAWVPLGAA